MVRFGTDDYIGLEEVVGGKGREGVDGGGEEEVDGREVERAEPGGWAGRITVPGVDKTKVLDISGKVEGLRMGCVADIDGFDGRGRRGEDGGREGEKSQHARNGETEERHGLEGLYRW